MQVHVVVRPGAAVGQLGVEGRRHAADAQALRVAAADAHVGLHHIQRLRGEEVAEAAGQSFVLPASQRHADLAAQLDQVAHVVVRHRLFEEGDVVSLKPARQAERAHVVEAAVGVDEDLHAGAHGLAHGANAGHVVGNHVVHRARLVAALQRVVAHRHLQTRETAAHPFGRRGGQFVAAEEGEAEGGVHRHVVACAAQQAPARLAQQLALDVPQRQVDGGNGMASVARLPARGEQPVEPVPQLLVPHRIAADQRVRGHVVDDAGDDFFLSDGRHAGAGDAGAGFHIHQADRQAGDAPAHGHGQVERRGVHAGDGQVGVVHEGGGA